jgi:hypothetical protein
MQSQNDTQSAANSFSLNLTADEFSPNKYDVFAYELLFRDVSKRDGNLEYTYTGFAIEKTKAEIHNISITPIKDEKDMKFSFWRYDVDFTPESHEIILVKYPKGKRDKFIDIKLVYSPVGKYDWSNRQFWGNR